MEGYTYTRTCRGGDLTHDRTSETGERYVIYETFVNKKEQKRQKE